MSWHSYEHGIASSGMPWSAPSVFPVRYYPRTTTSARNVARWNGFEEQKSGYLRECPSCFMNSWTHIDDYICVLCRNLLGL